MYAFLRKIHIKREIHIINKIKKFYDRTRKETKTIGNKS